MTKRLFALALALAAGAAAAQTAVALQGMLGSKALLIVDGAPLARRPRRSHPARRTRA
jgi:hypothetical protein